MGGIQSKPPRLVRKNRHHPKDFMRGTQKQTSGKARKKIENVSADTTSIPDPIPDTGIQVKPSQTSASIAASTTFTLPPVSQALSVAEASLASTTTAPVPDMTLSLTSVLSVSPSATNSPTSNRRRGASIHQQNSNSHRLSTASITLLAVGSGFALLGFLVIFKVCSRPRKRAHLIPSNPVLQDDYSSETYASDGSPIFGGKDRFSTANSGHTSTLWPWTQYHSGIPKPAATVKAGGNLGGAVGYVSTDREMDQYPSTGLTVPNTNLLQPVQNAVTRVASRLSTVSMSLYPNSPRDPYDVGLAIDGGSYTADGLPVLTRTQSTNKKRSSTLISGNTRDTMYTRYSQGFAYSGVDVSSPALPTPSQSLPKIAIAHATNSAGRARVKSSYYAPGAYPRASNANPDSDLPSAFKNDNDLPYDEPQRNLQPVQRSESRRDRDTHALTSALGLVSPIPPSPQPTLYPDDSLSMAGDFAQGPPAKSNVRNYTKPVPKPAVARHRLSTPPVDSSDTLGSLMLVDFGSGLAPSRSVKEVVGEQRSYANLKRTDDRPPRVPSPPPLPSLAQMGLAHANPEAYADYRSPTYSIYGLYEADRKSKATSFGY